MFFWVWRLLITAACANFSPQEWHFCPVASLKRRPAWTLMLLTTVLWPSRGPWLSPTAVPCRPLPSMHGKESWAMRRPPPRSSSNAPRSDPADDKTASLPRWTMLWLTCPLFSLQANGLAALGKYECSGSGGAAAQSLYVENHAY